MRIEKVKINGEGVEIHYSVTKGENQDVYSLITKDQPTKQFRESLQKLQPVVTKILELDEKYGAGMTVLGISLKFDKDNVRGAIITGTKLLSETKSSFVFNTPHLPEVPLTSGSKRCLPEGTDALIDDIIEQAELFLEGNRLQMDAFIGDPNDHPAMIGGKEAEEEHTAASASSKPKKSGRARNSKLVNPKLKLHTSKKK